MVCVRALAASGGGDRCLTAIRPHSTNSLSTSKVVLDQKSNKNIKKTLKKVFLSKVSLESAASLRFVPTQPIPFQLQARLTLKIPQLKLVLLEFEKCDPSAFNPFPFRE